MTDRLPRKKQGGWVTPSTLPCGDNGRALCRWCSTAVPKGRRTFCSEPCVHEWKLRSNPGYLRDAVFARDRGVCAICKVDTVAQRRDMKKMDYATRRKFLRENGLKEGSRKSLWDADHVVPVAEGGGQCDAANMRTLCLRCHREVTAALRVRLQARMASDVAVSTS